MGMITSDHDAEFKKEGLKKGKKVNGNYYFLKFFLDSGSQIHKAPRETLENIRAAAKPVDVKGINGPAVKLLHEGELQEFIICYTTLNEGELFGIISLSLIAKRYRIDWIQEKGFLLHLPSRDIWFVEENDLCVALLQAEYPIHVSKHLRQQKSDQQISVAHNFSIVMTEDEEKYPIAEVKRARIAFDFWKNAGLTSIQDLQSMINERNISYVGFGSEDVSLMKQLYGTPAAMLMGTMTKKKVSKQNPQNNLRINFVVVEMHVDVMHVGKAMFLISVLSPLGFVQQSQVFGKTAEILGVELLKHVNSAMEQRFHVKKIFDLRRIHTDHDSGLKALKGKLPGVEIDIGAAKGHTVVADQKIRSIKDMMRKNICMLDFWINFPT